MSKCQKCDKESRVIIYTLEEGALCPDCHNIELSNKNEEILDLLGKPSERDNGVR